MGLNPAGALSRWRGAERAGGKGQAKVWRWDLVARTKDAPRKEREELLFDAVLCNQNCASGLRSSEKSLNTWAQREMRFKYKSGLSNKIVPSELS